MQGKGLQGSPKMVSFSCGTVVTDFASTHCRSKRPDTSLEWNEKGPAQERVGIFLGAFTSRTELLFSNNSSLYRVSSRRPGISVGSSSR